MFDKNNKGCRFTLQKINHFSISLSVGSISAPDKHQTGIITSAGENVQPTSVSQGA